MKVLVTGVGGQLGYDVCKELDRLGIENKGVDVQDFDLTDGDAVMAAVKAYAPDAIIHCAAYTNVEKAESMPEVCADVNGMGTLNMVRAALAVNAKLMYISTDYVFDGQGEAPWQADCEDYAPLNVYGQTKLEGEQAARELVGKYFIVRIAWVFGLSGNNFIKTMLRLGQTHSTLRVVNDQVGTPTYTLDLARLLVDMIETEKFGVYHATNEGGFISWYDFACEIFRQAEMPVTVQPVTTAEYGLSKAARPFNSRLDKAKLVENGFVPLPHWRDALGRYLKEMQKIQ